MNFSKHLSASILALALLGTSPVAAQDKTAVFQDGISAYTSGYYDVWSPDWRMRDKRGDVSNFIRDGVHAYQAGNFSEAINLWERAAEKDDIDALIVLGIMYANGINVPQSIETAKTYHIKASKFLREADGRTKEAVQYVMPYAQMEYEDAKLELARVYLALHDTDNSAKADAILSPEFLAQSAEANYLKGTLAFKQTKGSIKQKLLARIEWQSKSGQMGYAPGQVIYGHAYEKGRGVDKSYENAAIWYKKAMAQNNASGFYNLGQLYENGLGVERNEKKAARLIEKAADLGHFSAPKDMAYKYQHGIGVEKDLRKAIEWYEKARKIASARKKIDQNVRIGQQIREIKAELNAQTITE